LGKFQNIFHAAQKLGHYAEFLRNFFWQLRQFFTIISGRLYRLKKIHFCSKIWELEIFWCLKIFRRMFFQDAQKHFGQVEESLPFMPKHFGHSAKKNPKAP
jgi:hypothetical protein